MRNNSWTGTVTAKGRKFLLFIIFLLGVTLSGCLVSCLSYREKAEAATVKIRYNGKTYKNKSKKMKVRYNNKTVSKKSYKALIINKKYMVPYTDVFKKGVKAKCKYKKAKKSLTISANGAKLVMTVGKKKAKLNGKSVKLPAAPLSVRYVSKKVTKILVPVNYVAKSLHLYYKKSGSTIDLAEPLVLTYDNTTSYYTGAQGNIYYNHKLYQLNSSMPVVKISGNMYAPAEETLKNIMGLDYDYNDSDHTISITNEDTEKDMTITVGSQNAVLNNKKITLSAAPKVVHYHKKNKDIICIPIATVLKHLNYTRSWNKKAGYYEIQNKEFFHWEKTPDAAAKNGSESGQLLYKLRADYQGQQGDMGIISFQLTGTNGDMMKAATINRSNNVITVTLPDSHYILDKNQFSNFGEIVDKMEITEEDGSVVISFICENVADYSYIFQNNTLVLNILHTYGTSSDDGSVIDHSLSIPKPQGISIANVTNEDYYTNKMFKIIIAGDHVSFFQNNPIIINNNKIKSLEVVKNGGSTEIIVSNTELMGYKIYDTGNQLEVKMGTPRKIYKNIVVLDAGHGGHDPGAKNKGTNEKDLTLKMVYTLMKNHFNSNTPEIKAYWTRTSDTFISLANRAAFAKSVGADAFISLHMNSANKSSANGTEVYYSVSNNSKGFGGITSQKMAKLFKTQLISDLKTKNRGVKTAGYYVIKHNTVPAILIELGFISGSSDYAKLVNPTFQNNAANSIYKGIESMFSTYKTGR